MHQEIPTAFIPLQIDDRGIMRIARTRVTLDSVLSSFNEGATAEEIAHQFSSLELADVYAIIGYYLRHREEVDSYLLQRKERAEDTRQQLNERHNLTGIRERLLARKSI